MANEEKITKMCEVKRMNSKIRDKKFLKHNLISIVGNISIRNLASD